MHLFADLNLCGLSDGYLQATEYQRQDAFNSEESLVNTAVTDFQAEHFPACPPRTRAIYQIIIYFLGTSIGQIFES